MANPIAEFLEKQAELARLRREGPDLQITVGMGTCGSASGAGEVFRVVNDLVKEHDLRAAVKAVGCIGYCEQEVLVDIKRRGEPRYHYGRITPGKIGRIIEEHILRGRPIPEWLVGQTVDEERPFADLPLYRKQRRIVLERCGFINPEKIDDYVAWGGYSALVSVLSGLSPEDVTGLITKAGLRGRGGAGFSTGLKWKFLAEARGERKFLICNADEGDPGAFMDRSILEGDPHAVIEGMLIGAFATGAQEGYFYVRAEYPLAIKRLKLAMAQAKKWGLLGSRILGTGFSFRLQVREGAGAFVCGEETALMASIEGRRGMPRPRPPYPAEAGLWGYPTNINNVETWANVPYIIRHGAEAYTQVGHGKSYGTKVFALSGKVANTGLVEVPMGMTLRELIFELAGGLQEGSRFKAVQIGGPSGGCLPDSLLDTPIDYDALAGSGAIMGSGGMVVVDEKACMVDFARYFMAFNRNESCGKCTPCREGTQRMLEILTGITQGRGRLEDLQRLKNLGEAMREASLCGLGQTAPNPVLTTLRYFEDEYRAHVERRQCPAGVCQILIREAIRA